MDTLFSGAMLVSRRVVKLDTIEMNIFPKEVGVQILKKIFESPTTLEIC